jgi:hypothetical protein
VLGSCVGKVEVSYVKNVAIKVVQEMLSPKNPVVRRMLGNRLVAIVAMNLSEASHAEEPGCFNMIFGMCQDTNYTVRRDSGMFFRDYLKKNSVELVGSDRLEDLYLPEIYELLNDEESYVRIEAIAAILEILEHLALETIETQFIPNFLKALVIKNNHDEIIARMAQLIGRVVHKLSAFDLHIKYKEQILCFYQELIEHREEENVMQGILNLPCFSLLYKDTMGSKAPGTAQTQSTSATGIIEDVDGDDDEEEKSCEIDFHELYSRFANEQSQEMRTITASCIHEAFLLASPLEDIKKLQQALCELLEEDNRDILLALNKNLKTLILRYSNEHTVNALPEAAVIGDNTPTKGFGLAHSNTLGSKPGDFTSAIHRKYEISSSKQALGGFKKLTSMNVGNVA